MLESGACDNKRTVSLDAIEATVLRGIERHLGAPELLTEYVQEFHRAVADLRDTSQDRRTELSKRLGEVEKAIHSRAPIQPRTDTASCRFGEREGCN